MRKVNYNTREEVHNWIVDALAIVKECKVPDDLRVAAFTNAFSMLSAQNVQVEATDFGQVAVPQVDGRFNLRH